MFTVYFIGLVLGFIAGFCLAKAKGVKNTDT